MQTNWQMNWQSIGASIIGSTHVRKGLPNQDAYGEKNLDGGIQVLALSDGHGGERHPYSALGSKAAVEAAIESVEAYIASSSRINPRTSLHSDVNALSTLRYDFEGQVSKTIQSLWLEKIQASPLFEEAIQFGCTLLLVVKFDDVIVCLQLGDGKIAVLYTDGIIYYPIPRDVRYENNETASMAQLHAWAEMKVVTMPYEGDIHAVVLASDGVENAFPEDYYDDAFFYMELALMYSKTDVLPLEKLGGQTEEEMLLDRLKRAAHYSKDDTTAVMWRNPETVLQVTSVPESLTIWMGNYPNQWLPIACYLEAMLSKRIEYAILLIEAIQKREGVVPMHLSLKQIYLDPETTQLEYIADGMGHPIDGNRLHDLIMQLLMLPDTSDFMHFGFELRDISNDSMSIDLTLRHMKRHLIMIQRQLRYDYTKQQFVCDGKDAVVSLSASNGNFPVFFDSDIYLHQLMSLVGDYDSLIGRVIQHVKYKSVWGLVNLTQHAWQVVGGKQKSIEPGMTLTLQDGVTAFIHGIPVKIRILNQ